MAQPPEQHEAKPAEQHEPDQARQTATLGGKVWTDVAGAWAEFMRLGNEPAPRVVLRSTRMPPPPRGARGRAPRRATNVRGRGSRRSAASRGSPTDDPEPPPPPRRAAPPRPPKRLGNPGRSDVRPRSVRGGRR
jgi:hypothetical protein